MIIFQPSVSKSRPPVKPFIETHDVARVAI
jgi:hypothetical protein